MNINQRAEYVNELRDWWTNRFRLDKYNIYLISLMYKHINGSPDYVLRRMQAEATEFVGRLITRITRKPNSSNRENSNPCFLMYPDLPVPKSSKQLARKPTHLNDGLHLQGMCAIPIKSRLKHPFKEHILYNIHLYIPKHSLIDSIHLEDVIYTPERAFSYIAKQVTRGVFGVEDMLLLPRSTSEVLRTSI